MKVQLLPLEFDIILCEGKNYTGNINMKILMKTAMKKIMKTSLCALAAICLAATTAQAATTGSATKPVGASDDLTTSDSGAVDSYSGAYATEGWYQPSKAFDGMCHFDDKTANTESLIPSAGGATDWNQTSPRWIVYKFNEATTVNAIGVATYGVWGNGTKCPKAWTFDASADGTTWTNLDTRENETGWTQCAYRYFKFDNETAYKYYRFYCTSLGGVPTKNGDAHVELDELEFYYVPPIVAPIIAADRDSVVGTTATITGSLAALGENASSATVTLEYGTTPELGSSAPVGTYDDATDPISATLTGLSYGTTYYYAFKAVNNAATPQTGWSATNSFFVAASTRFSDTLSIAMQNCLLTVMGTVDSWGLGTTSVELLVGSSADNLATVQTVSPSSRPAGDQIAFDPYTGSLGPCYVAIRAITTYDGGVWTNDTAATAVTISDAATYTWKGGAGTWSDSAMWATADAGAAGVPSAGSSVVIGDADSYITLLASVSVSNLTLSSVGKHEFRSNWMSSLRTLTVSGTFAFSGAGGGTLVFDSIAPKLDFISLGGISHLVVENYADLSVKHDAAGANGDFSGVAVTLVNGGKLSLKGYGNKVFAFDKLTVIGGACTLNVPENYAVTATFASFDAKEGSGVPVVNVQDGLISFSDVTGVEMVGGTQTLANPGPQIPVCTQFRLAEVRYPLLGYGACTLDGGTIRAIPATTMLDSLDGATPLDNVCITNETTVSSDATVNAVLFGRANCNLGGHTVTIKSGVFREKTRSATWSVNVTNGTFLLEKPNDFCNGSGEGGMNADYATAGETDLMKPMLSFSSASSKYPTKQKLSDFTGVLTMLSGNNFTLDSGGITTNTILEMRGGAIAPGDNNKRFVYRGLAGVSTWYNQKQNPFLYLGIPYGDDYWTDTSKNAMVVVGNKGILAPGVVDYDGERRGAIKISYHDWLHSVVFRDDAELRVALHDDGTSSYVDLSGTEKTAYIDVTLAGKLSVSATRKAPSGVRYPIIKYREGKLSGRFANVTQGFKVQYDVAQPDGSYAVTVTKGNAGTIIIVR